MMADQRYVSLGDGHDNTERNTAGRCCDAFDSRVCGIYDRNFKFETGVAGAGGAEGRKRTDVLCCLGMLLAVIADFVLIEVSIEHLEGNIEGNIEFLQYGYDYNGTACKSKQRCTWYTPTYPHVRYCREDNHCGDVTEYPAIDYQDRFCVPDWHNAAYRALYYEGSNTISPLDSYSETIVDVIGQKGHIALVTITGSIVLSILYLLAIHYNLRLLAYLVLNFVMGIVLAVLILVHGVSEWRNPLNITHSIIETVLGILCLLFMCMMAAWFHRHRTQLLTEVEMMAEAREVIFKLGLPIAGFAIFLTIVICAFYRRWIWQIIHIYSAMETRHAPIPQALIEQNITNTNNEYVWYDSREDWKLLLLHVPFGLFMMFWFGSVAYLVISHTICVWYLGKQSNLSRSKKSPTGAQLVFDAFVTVVSYHLGTAAFSALLSTVFIPSVPQFAVALFTWSKTQLRVCIIRTRMWNRRPRLSVSNLMAVEMNEETDELEVEMKSMKSIDGQRLAGRRASTVIDPNSAIEKEMQQNEKRLGMLRDAMYRNWRPDLCPLIEKKIMHAAHKTIMSALLDLRLDEVYLQFESVVEEKQEPETKSDLSAHVLSVIQENMHQFDYEQLIKDDIYAVIDAHIATLDKSRGLQARTTLDHGQREQTRSVLQVKPDDKPDDADLIPDTRLTYSDLRKEALVLTALYGRSLTYSAFRAKVLRRLNETRLSVEGSINYSEMFGRLGISITNAAILAIWLTVIERQPNNTSIAAIWVPCFIVLVITFAISNVFTLVFEATVHSLLYCVLLDDNRWNERFQIDEKRIKKTVTTLGSGLTSMLAEHLLIMQLREKEVNKKLNEMCALIASIGEEQQLSTLEIKLAQDKLRRAKRTALETERALLNSIDGPMKLTEYLINVILVENYFNHQYKDQKLVQENARRKYAQRIFDDEERHLEYVGKDDMKWRVQQKGKVTSFLSYFPVSDTCQLERAWSLKIDRIVQALQGTDKQYRFKMTGAKQKGIERAFYKSFYGYHDKPDGYLYLTDVLRCSFVFSDFGHLYRCFADLMKMDDEFEVIRVKDRFNAQCMPCGYRDLMMNVLCRAKTECERSITGIVCEIQLHHRIFYDAKKVSHRMYKRTRLFEKENGENKAYEYAKRYIRPILGRFKTYQMDGDEQSSKKSEAKNHENILDVIDKRIDELANKYSQDYVISNLG